jgi:hypothetical protein
LFLQHPCLHPCLPPFPILAHSCTAREMRSPPLERRIKVKCFRTGTTVETRHSEAGCCEVKHIVSLFCTLHNIRSPM